MANSISRETPPFQKSLQRQSFVQFWFIQMFRIHYLAHFMEHLNSTPSDHTLALKVYQTHF